MSLIAHVLEAGGIPTLVIGTVLDILERVSPPRAVFVDHPVGRTFGRPGAAEQQRDVLAEALAEVASFTAAGEIRHLARQYSPGGDRSWEAVVREELLSFGRG